VPGFEASAWFGVGAPKNTPSQIIDKLNETINAGLADPKIKARFADLGGTPLVGSAADFRKLIAEETEKWAKVVKFSGARRAKVRKRLEVKRTCRERREPRRMITTCAAVLARKRNRETKKRQNSKNQKDYHAPPYLLGSKCEVVTVNSR
jgi:Tripartite tricarboxylate transporter family receptor